MTTKKDKKEKEEIKEFVPHFMNDIKEETFIPEEIAGINAPQINQAISIET